MGVRTVLTRLLPGDETEVVVECRQCGATRATADGACPECGSEQTERFQIAD